MKMSSKTADLLLILTAVIWGSGFIGTEYAIDAGAKTSLIISMRFMLSGLILLVVFYKDIIKIDKKTFKIGVTAGGILFLGFYLQTFGQANTTVSNSSFLTGTSVIMVPFLVWIITKKAPKAKFFVLGLMSLVGITILTVDFSGAKMSFNSGDIFVFISALLFAGHITYLGIKGKGLNTKQMTFLQMMTAGVCGVIVMLVFDIEAANVATISKAFLPTLYLAVFSGCICYYLQTTAQQFTTPSKAGLFLSTEGFFGSLFSVMLGMDVLTMSLVVGGTIILSSVALSEVNISFKKKKIPDSE